MNAQVLNLFLLATGQIFEQVAHICLQKRNARYFPEGSKAFVQVAALVGFTGALKGQMVVAFDETFAMKIASAILMGVPVEEYNELAESGVCETANMIGGETCRRLLEIGYTCDLAVPTIIRGQMIEIGFVPKTPVFHLEFSSDWGPVQILINLEMPKPSEKNPAK